MIFFYQLLLQFIRTFKFLFRLTPHKKIQYFFQNEGQIHVASPLNARPIWIHASSGEIEYAKSLIRELKKSNPHIPLLVTHTSISSKNSVKNLDVAAYGVAPLDASYEVQAFLTKWNPRACLIARTDLWPQTLIELSKLQIPAYLFSATFASGSKKIGFVSRKLLKTCLPLIKKIYFVSSDDEALCKKYFPEAVGEVFGDTRYDQVVYRLSESLSLDLPSTEKVLIAGSTWQEDEKVLAPAFEYLKKHNWRFILVPHEVDTKHINKLTSLLHRRSIRFSLLSNGLANFKWKENDLLLVDKVGLLASLYSFAQIAFIGGSFRRQVHSVMEALATNSPVVLGPYFQNNREAIEFENLGYVRSVLNFEEFIKSVEFFEKNLAQIKPQLKKEFQNRLGVTEKLIQDLKSQGLFEETQAT